MAPDLPIVAFATPADMEAWLEEQGEASDGIWLKMAKKGSGETTVVYDEALEVALCHGWIDGQLRKLDERFYLQRFTPRRARSRWSQRNVQIAERLIAEGRMRPAGLAQVEAAKADGRWDAAYESPSKATVPDDLQAALDASPKAAGFFATLSSANRYAILYRVQDAKRPETRARRIAQYVQMLEEGRTFH